MLLREVFFSNHPEPMFVYDIATLAFLDVNASAIRHYAYSREEFLGMTIEDIRADGDHDALRLNVSRIEGGHGEAGIWRHRKKTGDLIHVRITSVLAELEGRGVEIVSATDVTDLVAARDEAVAALAEAEAAEKATHRAAEKVQVLLNAVPAKVLVLTAGDYKILAASDAYLETVRLPRERLVGQSFLEIFNSDGGSLAGLAKQQALDSLERVEKTLKADLMPIQYFPFAEAPEVPRYWSASNTPVLDGPGRLSYIMHQVEDVSELVLAASDGDHEAQTELLMSRPHLLPAMVTSHELKSAYLRLQEQDANLRMAQDLLGLGIWHLIVEGEGADKITWTDNIYAICGIKREEFSHDFDGYFRLVHPADQKRMINEYLAFLQSGAAIYRFEHRIVRPDGIIIHLEAIAELTQASLGKVLTGVVRDVTDRVEQIAQMKLLSSCIARVNDIVLIIETEQAGGLGDPRIVYANEAFERQTGYPASGAIGRTPRLLPGSVTQGEEVDWIRQALASRKPARAEIMSYTRDGDPFWIDLEIAPLGDESGAFTHRIAVGRDITERKALEAARDKENGRFELVMEATQVVIWDWTFADNAIWWNRNLSRLLGYENRNLQLSLEDWAEHIHPDDRERVLAGLQACRMGDAADWSEDYRMVRTDATFIWVADRAILQRSSSGEPVRMVGSMLDFTARQALEDQLRQAEKLDALGQLTGGIAHDFNNLLTVILASSESLVSRLPAGPLKEMAELSLAASESGAALVTRLLAFARRHPLDPAHVLLNESLSQMAALLRRTLPESTTLEFDLAPDLGLANIDIVQFETAVLNLCLNARDAMGAGGRIMIETANRGYESDTGLEVALAEADDFVMVAVTDYGAGMDAATLARVFEPFFTTKPLGLGTGLGLSMVYGFVKQSGGHVSITSAQGEGTTVKLFFPRARDAEVHLHTLEHDAAALLPHLKILVVEDNEFVLENIKRMLAELGMHFVCARTGPEALEKLAAHPETDLLFTDVILPGGMDGVQVAQAAREAKPGLRVLYTTGYAVNSVVQQVRQEPGFVLLAKPYRLADLAAKILEALENPDI
jgi:PAS domain S-box-containing protein